MPFVFSETTTLVVPDRFFFLLTNIVKRPFAYPKIRACKDTKCCLSINYKMDIFEWRIREKQENGKRKYRKKSDTVRLCADDLFNRQTLIAYHDNYASVMAKYGLQRGVRGSEARHTSTTQYYRDMKKRTMPLIWKTKGCRNRKPKPNRNSNEPRNKYWPWNWKAQPLPQRPI